MAVPRVGPLTRPCPRVRTVTLSDSRVIAMSAGAISESFVLSMFFLSLFQDVGSVTSRVILQAFPVLSAGVVLPRPSSLCVCDFWRQSVKFSPSEFDLSALRNCSCATLHLRKWSF